MNIENKLIFIIQIIVKKNKLRKYYYNNSNISKHIKKSHSLIKILVFFQVNLFWIIRSLTIVLFSKDQHYKFLVKVFKFLSFIRIFKFDKLEELIQTLIILHSKKVKKLSQSKKNNVNFKKIYQTAVIGSGPSGSLISYYLKKNKFDNILIESGGNYELSDFKHSSEEVLHKWKNGGIASSIGNNFIQYASGECFGGGSEINSGLINLPDKKFIDKIKKDFFIKDLNHSQIVKIINDIKKFMGVNNKLKKDDDLSKSFIKIIKGKKFEKLEKFYEYKSNKTIKKSMSNTYLKKYIEVNGNFLNNDALIRLKKNADTYKLSLKSGREIFAKNIFFCMGSPYTSFFLFKNRYINKNDIRFLKFHPMIKVIVKFNKKINKNDNDIIPYQLTEHIPKYLIGHASSSKEYLKISSLKYDLNENIDEDYEYFAIFHITYTLGKSKIITASPLKEPLYKFDIDKKDMELIKRGLKEISRIFLKDDSVNYIFPIVRKTKKLTKPNDLRIIDHNKSKSDFNLSSVHLLGGLPIGESNSVLDSYGKLKKDNGIYVSDSSIICGNLLRNPQATVMALAHRNIHNYIKKNE